MSMDFCEEMLLKPKKILIWSLENLNMIPDAFWQRY